MSGSPADARSTDFVISRVFDAPRDLVWKAFTEPERMQHWWGPKGFTNTFHEFDLRPGGVVDVHDGGRLLAGVRRLTDLRVLVVLVPVRVGVPGVLRGRGERGHVGVPGRGGLQQLVDVGRRLGHRVRDELEGGGQPDTRAAADLMWAHLMPRQPPPGRRRRRPPETTPRRPNRRHPP